MSATAQEKSITDLILEEAERISPIYYQKPYGELNEALQYGIIKAAKNNLRQRNIHIPGECDDCGAWCPESWFQCYPCRKGETPRTSYLLHSRESVMI